MIIPDPGPAAERAADLIHLHLPARFCATLRPQGCGPPGFSVQGLSSKKAGWGATPCSRRPSPPGDQTAALARQAASTPRTLVFWRRFPHRPPGGAGCLAVTLLLAVSSPSAFRARPLRQRLRPPLLPLWAFLKRWLPLACKTQTAASPPAASALIVLRVFFWGHTQLVSEVIAWLQLPGLPAEFQPQMMQRLCENLLVTQTHSVKDPHGRHLPFSFSLS